MSEQEKWGLCTHDVLMRRCPVCKPPEPAQCEHCDGERCTLCGWTGDGPKPEVKCAPCPLCGGITGVPDSQGFVSGGHRGSCVEFKPEAQRTEPECAHLWDEENEDTCIKCGEPRWHILKAQLAEANQHEGELLAKLMAANAKLEALGPGPFVPKHQYDNACKQREEANARAEKVEAENFRWQDAHTCLKLDFQKLEAERDAERKAKDEWMQLQLQTLSDHAIAAQNSRRFEGELARARELQARAERVLRNNGFRTCDIAACNCGSWHLGPNLRAERAEERAWQAEQDLEDEKVRKASCCDAVEQRALQAERERNALDSARLALAEELNSAHEQREQAERERDGIAAINDDNWKFGQEYLKRWSLEKVACDLAQSQAAQLQAEIAGLMHPEFGEYGRLQAQLDAVTQAKEELHDEFATWLAPRFVAELKAQRDEAVRLLKLWVLSKHRPAIEAFLASLEPKP